MGWVHGMGAGETQCMNIVNILNILECLGWGRNSVLSEVMENISLRRETIGNSSHSIPRPSPRSSPSPIPRPIIRPVRPD